MKTKRTVFTHILMVAAPLLMIAAITAAWFISSNTVDSENLTFASIDSGPGAALHRSVSVTDRVFTPAVSPAPATLANTVKWGAEELPSQSEITIKNMVPGQCEYYFLLSGSPFTVRLANIALKNAKGEALTSGETLPLAQCLGFYLIPTTLVEGEKIEERIDVAVPISLTRAAGEVGPPATDGPLLASVLRGELPAAPLTPTTGTAQSAYILAVFCDPIYLQQSGHVTALEGEISFSLAFEQEEKADG